MTPRATNERPPRNHDSSFTADSLGDASDHLPLADGRIDDRAAVVGDRVLEALDDAALRVDVADRDVHGGGDRYLGRVVHLALLEPRLEALGQVVCEGEPLRDLRERERALRAAPDAEAPVGELDVVDARLKPPPASGTLARLIASRGC